MAMTSRLALALLLGSGLCILGCDSEKTPTTPPTASAPHGDGHPSGCLRDVPDDLIGPMINSAIVHIGVPAQRELTRFFLRSQRLDHAQRATVSDFESSTSGTGVPSTAALAAAQPGQADIEVLALHLIDYRWFAARSSIDPAGICAQLVIRANGDCGSGNALDQHNLYVSYLRNRKGLCAGPVDWSPADGALPLVRDLSAVIAAPAYFAALERWLENRPGHAFRLTENFFTLLYVDYLSGAFEHRQIDLAYREFLLRRRDLRERYPGLESVRQQLGRMKDLGLIE